jgi:NTP pyrophosphatase (non-canonical NTP hydrolase)
LSVFVDLAELRKALREFAADRDWDQFHTPKNLCMAITGEVGELAAELQWLSDEEVERGLEGGTLRATIAAEMADVLIYLVRLGDVTGIDLMDAALSKLRLNSDRYPADQVRGKHTKYTAIADS